MHSVLIVDDEPFVRLSIASLRPWPDDGYDFRFEASDGEAALELLDAERGVDIVILDISMPGMDGIEFLRRLRARGGVEPAVVVLSAYDDYRRVREAFTLGALDYLLKSEIDGRSVKAALDKAAASLASRSEAREPFIDRNRLDSLKARLLADLLQGGDSEELCASLAGLGLEFGAPFAVCAFWIEDFAAVREKWGPEEMGRFSDMIRRSLAQVLAKRGRGEVATLKPGHAVVLFAAVQAATDATDAATDAATDTEKAARSFCADAVEYLGRYLGVGAAWTVGPSCDSLARAAASYDAACAATSVDSRIIVLAKRAIRERFADPEFSLEEAAAKAGVSKNHLSYEFSRETGRTFTEYLANVRIEEAKRLMATTDLLIYEICERVGYPSVEHFSRTFKRLAGQSPARFKSASDAIYP
jgi:two-component system response regulator YesN